MSDKNSFKYSCLFGGGAIRGVAYVGAVKAMEELGIKPHTLAGSSVGSILAGLVALNYTAEEIKEVFLKFNYDVFRDVQFSLGPKLGLSKGEYFLEWIRDLIEKKFYGDKYQKGTHKGVTFKDIDNDLVIITTDLSSFECKEFSRYETPDFEIATAIRISCSMPGLMQSIEYNNRILVDGDLQKSWPMWKLSEHLRHDDERILEFRLEGDFQGNDKNTIEYVNSLYAFTTSMATTFIIDIFGKRDMFDYIVINTGDINIVDFNMSDEKKLKLMDLGYSLTMDYFNDSLPIKKGNLLRMYKKLFNKCVIINKHLKKQNYLNAKSMTSEIFIDLCEYKEYIDEKIYDNIVKFKNEFFANISYPALFGKTKLRNKDSVNKQLVYLLTILESKNAELNDYLLEKSVDNETCLA